VLTIISSCQKSEELTKNSSIQDETIKKMEEAGLKQMTLASFPKNAKIRSFETEEELNLFLDTLKKVKYPAGSPRL
jgi:hypothetical protein